MRKSTKSDSIIFGSAFALMVTGIAVIVIGTWTITPEGDDQKNVTVIEKTYPSPQAGGAPEMYFYPTNVMNLPVFSADGQRVGNIVKVSVTAEGEVSHLYVEMPEFLGLGTKEVRVPSAMLERREDRVDLVLTAAAVNRLPAAE